MRIGIGVTSYKRPEHLDLWRDQYLEYGKPSNAGTYYIDEPVRKGIAYGKNQCLEDLKDCDYIFLFDDDCFPIKKGWEEFFINHHKKTGDHHFLYLRETANIICTSEKNGLRIFNNCGGCFMFLTKEVIEKVGGFNKDYGYYGFEHAGYTNRIHEAGMTPTGNYLCPLGSEEYIYAMDYDFHRKEEFQDKVNHAPSMIDEIESIPDYIEQNKQIYLHDKGYQPL